MNSIECGAGSAVIADSNYVVQSLAAVLPPKSESREIAHKLGLAPPLKQYADGGGRVFVMR